MITQAERKIIMTGKERFEIKAKIVRAGDSKVLKNWRTLVPDLTDDDFLDALAWLCEDEREDGRLRREIGLTKNGIVRLRRCYELQLTETGVVRMGRNGRPDYLCTFCRIDNGTLWEGDVFQLPVPPEQMAWYGDTIGTQLKLCLSCEDRI